MTDLLQDHSELVVAKAELDALYEWLSQSPTGTSEDLHALDTAITVIGQLIAKLNDPEVATTEDVSVGLAYPGDATGSITHNAYAITISHGATMIAVEGTGPELDGFASRIQKMADRANIRKGLLGLDS